MYCAQPQRPVELFNLECVFDSSSRYEKCVRDSSAVSCLAVLFRCIFNVFVRNCLCLWSCSELLSAVMCCLQTPGRWWTSHDRRNNREAALCGKNSNTYHVPDSLNYYCHNVSLYLKLAQPTYLVEYHCFKTKYEHLGRWLLSSFKMNASVGYTIMIVSRILTTRLEREYINLCASFHYLKKSQK